MFQKIEPLVEIVYGAAFGFRLGGVTSGFAFSAILSMRELTTDALEYSMVTAGGLHVLGFGGRLHHLIGETQLHRFPASIQVSASMRWESLARDKPVLIS